MLRKGELDDIPHLPLRLAVLGVTFCLSGFFSGSETALFSLQPDELARMRGRAGVDGVLARLRSRPRRLLITILFGNMLVNVVFFGVSFTIVLALAPRLSRAGGVLLGLGSLMAIILGGEAGPKNLAVTFGRPFARAVAYPMLVICKLLVPVTWPLAKLEDFLSVRFGPGVSPSVRTDELRTLVRIGTREGVVDAAAGEMISEVIGLADVRIGELMVPRVEMVSFDLNAPESALLPMFQRARLTHMPVYQGRRDNMLGLVHVKDVLLKEEGRALGDLLRPAPFLPASATVEEALAEFRREGAKTAFVVDEHGAVLGLVTVEDLLEVIVGEIADEYDRLEVPDVAPLGGGYYRIRGSLSLRRWRDVSGWQPPRVDVDTVGGLVMALLDRMPRAGDSVVCRGMRFTVETVRDRRAGRIVAGPATAERGELGEANDA